MGKALTERWYPLKYHKQQRLLWNSSKRFIMVPAGRRAGKSELAKRKLVIEALNYSNFSDGVFIFALPTFLQAKRTVWNDLKAMVPTELLASTRQASISESELIISLYNGAKIYVVGLDKPQRIEGMPIDFIMVDEYGNCKSEAWYENIRPALSTLGRIGKAWLIGVPEGRNHYYDLSIKIQDKENRKEWDYFTWKSASVLDPHEIAMAKRELDTLTFQQEYEANFINFSGRCYYSFDKEIHAQISLDYNPELPLTFTFDFNREPGVAAVIQEQLFNHPEVGPKFSQNMSSPFTAVIDEVYIERNSNTEKVVDKLISDWKFHQGSVYIYGDPAGGHKTSSSTEGSDWDIIYKKLYPVFGDNIELKYPESHPPVRSRVNSMNSRILSTDNVISFLVDPSCINVIKDFEGVTVVEGGTGEINKKDLKLSHLSDAISYQICEKYPINCGDRFTFQQM